MPDTLIVDISHGGSFAPCSALYRIRNEDAHRAAMAHVAAMGGPEDPEDDREDNILLSEEDAEGIIAGANRRKLSDWREGWDVAVRLDRWEAFAYYGYDAGDTLGS